MLNFRYHIVSLTAVFLALAIGVIAGTTVVPRPLLNQLRSTRDNLAASRAELRARNASLERQVALWERYGEAEFAAKVAGRLSGVTVVRVITGGPTKALRDKVDETLAEAGARSGGTVILTDRWTLDDERSRDALGALLAVAERDQVAMWTEAGERLSERLTREADPRAETDLLRLLSNEGFLRLEDAPPRFPPKNAVIMVLSGGDDEAGGPAIPFLSAFAQGLSGGRAVFSEPVAAPDPGAEELRADLEIKAGVGTVDHVDTALGRYSLVVALAREARSGPPEHYGVGERADSLGPVVAREPNPAPSRSPPAP